MTAPPPQIAAIREAQALVATYKAHEARQDSADPLALVWSARQIAPLLTALAAALERVTADHDRLQHYIECANTPLMRDVLAERDRLRETLTNITHTADPGHARDLARAALAGGTDAAPPECDGSRSCPAAVHVHGCFAERRVAAPPEQKP